MEELILSKSNSISKNILAIIEFVKQVEREHGLTEEAIIHKYTCGQCYFLAMDVIIPLIKRLKYNMIVRDILNDVDNDYIGKHCYVEVINNIGKGYYFDIIGKKTYVEMRKFVNSDYWDKEYKKPWVAAFESKKWRQFADTDYVLEACKNLIKIEQTETKTV